MFFFSFFCVFFLFSDVKVDFSLGGPVFFLDSRNFGKSPFFCLLFLFSDVLDSWNSCFFSLFFCVFFLFSDVKVDFSHGGPVFFLDSWNSCFFSLFFVFFFCFYYVYFLFFLNWYFQTFHMKDSFKCMESFRGISPENPCLCSLGCCHTVMSGLLSSD